MSDAVNNGPASYDLTDVNVLVTGGTGFIGSHTVVQLIEAGCKVTIMDNLQNSFLEVLKRVKVLVGPEKAERIRFEKLDMLDAAGVDALFASEKYDTVIHFAGLKAVGESVEKPLYYYRTNFCGTVNILEAMVKYNVKNIVFSSSCTVYGLPEKVPLDEQQPVKAISPYGRTKLFQEEMFRDVCNIDKDFSVILLRYFNPVAAHPSGLIGEHPVGIPTNLMPFVQQVAVGIRPELKVFGGDYPTRDGTCIRDYIHVMDLADSHVAAVAKIAKKTGYGCKAINVGTGTGSTVIEMVNAFEKACGHKIPYTIVDRRAGDTIAVWAATEYAEKELGWKAKYNIDDMCRDQWKWASSYPRGYEQPLEN
eukprot:TRINITY_DN35899_c0_g2_i1.p1 TRINITY_DN35899_c0_g2~~TRINITY_DN35899_c0_g2_i1.p1  ORF type:complete len:421 (-),score=41.87 TRINITY_DN35899_c0_g2_i1:615-1706(-)